MDAPQEESIAALMASNNRSEESLMPELPDMSTKQSSQKPQVISEEKEAEINQLSDMVKNLLNE